jgi:hypothetical protein
MIDTSGRPALNCPPVIAVAIPNTPAIKSSTPTAPLSSQPVWLTP